jgi:adenylate cyclase class 2
MGKDNKEIEIKFKVSGISRLREKLGKLGAKNLGRVFERTIRFDTPEKDLEKSNKYVRVRTGFKNVITFKQKLAGDTKFKVRREIEFKIEDPEKMGEILEGLGFTKKLIMEKYREKWQLPKVEVVIDELPFGNFMEIEAGEKEITETAEKLGLKLSEGLTQSYWELNRNLGSGENILFKRS